MSFKLSSHVERLECHRIEMLAGHKTECHLHEGGVIGYVLEGEIEFQIEGHPSDVLKCGSVFVEPPNCRIAKFDNCSHDRRALFLAFYPLSQGQSTLTTLESMT